jgi:hypothetical protein
MTTNDFVNQLNRPLGPGMPEESAGLAPSGAPWLPIGMVRGVNDRWACLVEGFRPTEYELVVLAKHYLDEIMNIDFFYRWHQTTGSSEWRTQAFASRRLDAIEQALGEAKFNAVIAKRLAGWRQKFADADKEEESLDPCTSCGTKRVLSDLWRARTHPDLCEACVPPPASATALEPCAACGRQRDVTGSAYTGDLCWECASERLAPCANCGDKRKLSARDDALCDACLMETVPPCKHCGAKRHPSSVSSENDHGYCDGCTW